MHLETMIVDHWEFNKAQIVHHYEVKGGRIVCKVTADEKDVLVKGLPITVDEAIVMSNTQAHQYLGNTNSLAPCLVTLSDGSTYLKGDTHYFYMMEFIEGRQLLECEEDEYLLGRATAKLHKLDGYLNHYSLNCEKQIRSFRGWFTDRHFKREFDALVDSLPDFSDYEQCFIHTDIGPHNGMMDDCGNIVFVDLDDAGYGPRHVDLGWPFIMQFVDYNKQTHEMTYRFDLAKAFLTGYYGGDTIPGEEYDKLWEGAVYMHMCYMQSYGPDAVESLWKILKFGIEQKEKLYKAYHVNI